MAKMTVRMTLRIDTDDRVDVAFLRAVLRRMDVCHCTAKGGNIHDIIDPKEYGTLKDSTAVAATATKAATTPTYKPYTVIDIARPWRNRDKSTTTITLINEIRHPLPIVPPEQALVTLDKSNDS